MSKKTQMGIVGFGNMGRAIGDALCYQKSFGVCVYDKDKKKTKGVLSIAVKDTLEGLLKCSDIIILAIKPQDIKYFTENARSYLIKRKILLISIAAGVPTYFFEKEIGKVRVVRVMPNLAAKVKEAVSFICKGRFASEKDLSVALSIFKNIGIVFKVKENFLDKATSISGSGPGYVYYFMDAFYRSALKLGFGNVIAREMIIQTVWGATRLLKENGDSFTAAMKKVASKGGTTQAGFNIFEKNKLKRIIEDTVKAAFLRARELNIKL